MTNLYLVILIGCCVGLGWIIREHLSLQQQVRDLAAEVHQLKRPSAQAKHIGDGARRVRELFNRRTRAILTQPASPAVAPSSLSASEGAPTDPGVITSPAAKGDIDPQRTDTN